MFFEQSNQPLIPIRGFIRRQLITLAAGLVIVALSLLIGMAGYRAFEHLSWIDAFLNAAMLLGGMGPIDHPNSAAGKIFAGVYALYAGFTLLATVGIVLSPLVHRLLHHFHLEEQGDDPDNK